MSLDSSQLETRFLVFSPGLVLAAGLAGIIGFIMPWLLIWIFVPEADTVPSLQDEMCIVLGCISSLIWIAAIFTAKAVSEKKIEFYRCFARRVFMKS